MQDKMRSPFFYTEQNAEASSSSKPRPHHWGRKWTREEDEELTSKSELSNAHFAAQFERSSYAIWCRRNYLAARLHINTGDPLDKCVATLKANKDGTEAQLSKMTKPFAAPSHPTEKTEANPTPEMEAPALVPNPSTIPVSQNEPHIVRPVPRLASSTDLARCAQDVQAHQRERERLKPRMDMISAPRRWVAMAVSYSWKILVDLGTGYSESVYQNALYNMIRKVDPSARIEQKIPIMYEAEYVGTLRADIMTDLVVIETKAQAVCDFKKAMQQAARYARHADHGKNRAICVINFNQESGFVEFDSGFIDFESTCI